MFKRSNWLPNLFMLMSCIFFVGVFITFLFSEIIPRIERWRAGNQYTLIPVAVQIYKMPELTSNSADDEKVGFFTLSDPKDGIIVYHTENKNLRDMRPPSKMDIIFDIELPPDFYDKNLDFFFSYDHKVLKKFPQINLQSLFNNVDALPVNCRGRYFYKTYSTDRSMLVYLIFEIE